MTEKNFTVNQGITIKSFSSNEDELLIIGPNGEIESSGVTISDISSNDTLSVFEPLLITSDANGIAVLPGPEYLIPIQKSYGNLIAVDADENTYDEIEIGISTEWSITEVGTFRLDLVVNSGQTFTFDSSIDGLTNIAIPASGVVSLLFDKPYGTDTWYVRQVI